jgi:hypothetical protein
MPKYNITFNVKLDEQIEIVVDATDETDAITAADIIALEVSSDPIFLIDNLQLACSGIEAQTPQYTPLNASPPRASTLPVDTAGYTSLASLYTRSNAPCAPCQGDTRAISGYTRLT